MVLARDVTVRGAGIFGLSVAYACARRGARVRVIETRAVAAGSSGGVVGALAPYAPDGWNAIKQFQFDCLATAEHHWRGVEALSGIATGYARLGRLQPVADEAALARACARGDSALQHWTDTARWEVVPAPEGWAPASPTGLVIRDTLSARLHPASACKSLAAAIRTLGGEIVVGDGTEAGAVIWATGHEGLAELASALDRPVGRGIKGQAAVFALDRRDAPQIFADGLHVVPHADGTVAVGSTTERDYGTPDTTDAALDQIIARARAACAPLAGAPVIRRWAGVRPRARSRAPMLGAWPERPGHFIANGGFKIGFGIAHGCAEILADLVLEGRDAIPDPFRLEASL